MTTMNDTRPRAALRPLLALALAVGAFFLFATVGEEAATPPATTPTAPTTPLEALVAPYRGVLAGFDDGLYAIEPSGIRALWKGGDARRLLRLPQGWYLQSQAGIVFSPDLVSFEPRSSGLPVKLIKRYRDGVKSFEREVQDIKDLEADPLDPMSLVVCTKDEVFHSADGGLVWRSLGSPSSTTGLKAVAIAHEGGSPVVLASHPIKGVFKRPLAGKAAWTAFFKGLPGSGTIFEEVADIKAVVGADGSERVYASLSFLPRLFVLDAKAGAWTQVYDDGRAFGSLESIEPRRDGLSLVTQGGLVSLDASGRPSPDEAGNALARGVAALAEGQLECLLAEGASGASVSASELWLLAFRDLKPHRAAAEGRHAIYVPTGYMKDGSREPFIALMKSRNVEAVVVDLKDDFGRLRFEPRSELVRRIGKVSSPLDVETFVADMKARGIYLIARIVVFKDQVVFEHKGGKYAVWDSRLKTPWRGYRLVPAPVPEVAPATPAAPAAPATPAATPALVPGWSSPTGVAPSGPAAPAGPAAKPAAPAGPVAPSTPAAKPAVAAPAAPPKPVLVQEPYGEYWADPYSEEVWEYNVAIARELVERGFDEIQFDYIRFPTDGENLGDASFRWKDAGMDKEGALMSFLSYARENVDAPISIDIYGANGWYRSGVRTGQDTEILSRYVDVICPMLYPSHFEQAFLAQAPAELRPYRIYYFGSLRNAHIARGRVVVRPFVQAFYLPVSYDKKYYDKAYVLREVQGVRDSVNLGLTFWNNSGRYDDLPVLELLPDRRLAGSSPGGLLD